MDTRIQGHTPTHTRLSWLAGGLLAATAIMSCGSDHSDGGSEEPADAAAAAGSAGETGDQACKSFCWHYYTYPSHFLCAYTGGSCAAKTCECQCGLWGAFRKHDVGPGACSKGAE